MSASFGVVVLVAPGEANLGRMRDTIESLNAYETDFRLILVDDSVRARGLEQWIPAACLTRTEVLQNPRRGKGDGLGGGTTTGFLAGLRRLQEIGGLEFAIKLDTDSLVIGAFSDKIADRFRANPQVGELGYYRFNPTRVPDREPNFLAAPAFLKLSSKATLWRRRPGGRLPMVQLAFWGRRRQVREVIRRALLNGYRLGEHCNGGGFAISSEAMRRLAEGGLLRDAKMRLHTPCGEDAVISLLVRSVGLLIDDFNDDQEPFGIKHLGLPDEPENLVRRGFSIIHSVKDYGPWRESDTRAFFRARRVAVAAGSVKGSRA